MFIVIIIIIICYYKDDVKKVEMRIIIKTVLRDCRQRASIRENITNTQIHTLVYYNELLLKCMLTGSEEHL